MASKNTSSSAAGSKLKAKSISTTDSNPQLLYPSTATNPTVPPNLQPTAQEAALTSLLTHCANNNVYISPSITARSTISAGLGVYINLPPNADPLPGTPVRATRIRKNERLIHVPTAALLTTQSIPESFLPRNIIRRKFTVHCALAAYLAFGGEEVQQKYGGWIATWPEWEDFLVGMPVFWGADFRVDGRVEGVSKDGQGVGEGKAEIRAKKRRKTISEKDSVGGVELTRQGEDSAAAAKLTATLVSNSNLIKIPSFSRGPGVDETTWLTLPSHLPRSSASTVTTTKTHLSTQALKLRQCIQTIDTYLPHLQICSPTSHASYIHFLHMWAIVNTRCFYYLRPGQAPPSDSNEAMALCPFQDLFNHASPRVSTSIKSNSKPTDDGDDDQDSGCIGAFDKRGFYITSSRGYSRHNEELFLCYGRHSNDMLWMEYGFFLGGTIENRDDYVRLDPIVLAFGSDIEAEFTPKQKSALEKAGYLGKYTLRSDGVCYRTVVASYLGVLDDAQWARLVSGGLDPDSSPVYALARLRAKRRIAKWVVALRREAEVNLQVLVTEFSDQDEDVLVGAFVNGGDRDGHGDGTSMLTEGMRNSRNKVIDIATRRKEMCVRRWMQVFDLCMLVLRALESECPGAIVGGGGGEVEEKEEDGEKREREELGPELELENTAQRFVDGLGNGRERGWNS